MWQVARGSLRRLRRLTLNAWPGPKICLPFSQMPLSYIILFSVGLYHSPTCVGLSTAKEVPSKTTAIRVVTAQQPNLMTVRVSDDMRAAAARGVPARTWRGEACGLTRAMLTSGGLALVAAGFAAAPFPAPARESF